MGISADSPEDSAALAQDLGARFDMLSDPSRQVISAYGVADAGPELAMPAVFVVRQDGVITWRVVGESMRDLPLVDEVLNAATAARTPQAQPAAPEPAPPAADPPATEEPTETVE